MLRWVWALAAAAFLLAGCTATSGQDGQQAAAAGHLTYNGASGGKHQADHDCADGSGTVSFSASMGAGKVSVRVRDAAGQYQYASIAEGSSSTSDSQPVTGAPGGWILSAERTPTKQYGSTMWSGSYTLSLSC